KWLVKQYDRIKCLSMLSFVLCCRNVVDDESSEYLQKCYFFLFVFLFFVLFCLFLFIFFFCFVLSLSISLDSTIQDHQNVFDVFFPSPSFLQFFVVRLGYFSPFFPFRFGFIYLVYVEKIFMYVLFSILCMFFWLIESTCRLYTKPKLLGFLSVVSSQKSILWYQGMHMFAMQKQKKERMSLLKKRYYFLQQIKTFKIKTLNK
ncbi:hypothetical protein RFI_04914, partial [Reticulomyxa filosa]